MRKINKSLEENGFFNVNSFLTKNEIRGIENIFPDILKTKIVNENTAKINYSEIHKYKLINQIYKKIKKLLLENIRYNFYLRNVWLISTKNENYKKNELPFIPHIDKKRYLKVFLYINDIKKKNGAFTVSTNSNLRENEKLRLDWWSKNFKNPKIDKHGLTCNAKELKFKPIEMEKGSIVCFDTNTPHFAGKVEPGYERKVLRFNFFFDAHVSKISFIKQKSIAELSRGINYLKDFIK